MSQALASLFHFTLIVLTWTSPFWLDWRLVMAGSFVLIIQYIIYGGCVLTKMEGGKSKYATFYHHHLVKIFPSLPEYPFWFFMRFIAPVLIPLLAFWWQVLR